MKTILELTSQQLRRAAQIKEQISSLERQLQGILGQGAPGSNGGMSAAARAKISAAAKARWAKIKAKGGQSLSKPAQKPAQKSARKPMSAAQKAKIAATLKARWAKIKAAKK
jgi:hypothetical protein